MNKLDEDAFRKFMAERGYDVEFDSGTPGFYDSDGNKLFDWDDVFPGGIVACLIKELEKGFEDSLMY